MAIEIEKPNPTNTSSAEHSKASAAELIIGFSILGCIVAGCIALFKAFQVQAGTDVLLCVVSAVIAFGFVVYLYFGKLGRE